MEPRRRTSTLPETAALVLAVVCVAGQAFFYRGPESGTGGRVAAVVLGVLVVASVGAWLWLRLRRVRSEGPGPRPPWGRQSG